VPDYWGCAQEKCKKKATCARFLMEFDKHQNMLDVKPHPRCEGYWNIGKRTPPFKLDQEKIKRCREESDE